LRNNIEIQGNQKVWQLKFGPFSFTFQNVRLSEEWIWMLKMVCGR